MFFFYPVVKKCALKRSQIKILRPPFWISFNPYIDIPFESYLFLNVRVYEKQYGEVYRRVLQLCPEWPHVKEMRMVNFTCQLHLSNILDRVKLDKSSCRYDDFLSIIYMYILNTLFNLNAFVCIIKKILIVWQPAIFKTWIFL